MGGRNCRGWDTLLPAPTPPPSRLYPAPSSLSRGENWNTNRTQRPISSLPAALLQPFAGWPAPEACHVPCTTWWPSGLQRREARAPPFPICPPQQEGHSESTASNLLPSLQLPEWKPTASLPITLPSMPGDFQRMPSTFLHDGGVLTSFPSPRCRSRGSRENMSSPQVCQRLLTSSGCCLAALLPRITRSSFSCRGGSHWLGHSAQACLLHPPHPPPSSSPEA